MIDHNSSELLTRLLPDIPGTRLLLIGAGGIGLAATELARDLGVTIIVANRSQPKLDNITAAMPDVATYLIDARSQDSVNKVLDATQPDHILLATGRVFGASAGSVELEKAMDYFGDRMEPIIAIANWIANSPRKPRSFTIVSGFIGVPVMGNMTWSAMGVAIKGLVEHLAVELGPVRVNAVAPGPVLDTQMCRDVVGDEGVAAMEAGLTAQLPIRRPVVTDDVARQITFVIGDPITTGSIRFTEGGLSLVPSSVLRDAHIEKQGH